MRNLIPVEGESGLPSRACRVGGFFQDMSWPPRQSQAAYPPSPGIPLIS